MTRARAARQADDEARSAIMPVNRRYDLEALLASINAYQKKTKRRVTFEWAAIAGENDDANAARKLGRLLKRHAVKDAHVNVIPLNPTAGFTGKKSTNGNVDSFCRTLEDEFGISATPRVRRGIDIDAGCGQLTTALEGARPPAAAPGSEIAGEIYEGGIASGVAAASPFLGGTIAVANGDFLVITFLFGFVGMAAISSAAVLAFFEAFAASLFEVVKTASISLIFFVRSRSKFLIFFDCLFVALRDHAQRRDLQFVFWLVFLLGGWQWRLQQRRRRRRKRKKKKKTIASSHDRHSFYLMICNDPFLIFWPQMVQAEHHRCKHHKQHHSPNNQYQSLDTSAPFFFP